MRYAFLQGFQSTNISERLEIEEDTQSDTTEELAEQLSTDFWTSRGDSPRSFDVEEGGTITVDYTGLTPLGKFYAHFALQMWSDATGLEFEVVQGNADITFDDNDSGAYTTSEVDRNGTIESSYVNISDDWNPGDGYDFSNYTFQTYVHEIGHALGLGHAGDYNGSAQYGVDNLYDNDSWQATIMSYFDQEENTDVDADFAYVATPQAADVLAIQDLYGTTSTTRTEDTTYGDNGTAGVVLNQAATSQTPTTYTIVDDGGIDTLDYSSSFDDQVLDLREGAISDVRGVEGSLIIAEGTGIENAIGGSGDDTIIANDLDNTLTGGSGSDIFLFYTNESASANSDTITDFEDGSDIIYIDDGVSGTTFGYDQLEFADAGSGTSILYDDDEIILENVDTTSLGAEDFMFA
ncbi:M10 family metallopeptidase [Roseibium sp. RKSG952]|uniref:M10 family metallopeptidase n=1 Tax=Roseibium sp. RKSG952 TaxID=2529384 RepID=UPI0012BC7BB5|nr:M10 family metallopeptidase [Roseibium sp. RKSG952]MTH96820.1 alkaline metalloproteinase [Roseibium sp. RKSG952]